MLGLGCIAKQDPAPAPHHEGLPWPSAALRGGYKASPKANDAGTIDPCAAQPCLVLHMHFGSRLGPRGKASAASLLSTAGAAHPVPPRPGEAAAKGLILQPPSPSPCFTSRSPSTDQRALRFSLHSLKCSQRATRCCQQPPAVGTGLSPPHHNHLLIAAPPAGRRLARSVDPQHRSAPSSHAGCPPWCLGLRRSPAPW